jgi:endonuclease/exonuclease/phosphatase family metal-dependent hydrolase
MARLDRIIVSEQWSVLGTNVHHSALSAIGSDHLPVFASLELPKK